MAATGRARRWPDHRLRAATTIVENRGEQLPNGKFMFYKIIAIETQCTFEYLYDILAGITGTFVSNRRMGWDGKGLERDGKGRKREG